jgi:hypothetical protein
MEAGRAVELASIGPKPSEPIVAESWDDGCSNKDPRVEPAARAASASSLG